MIYQGTITYNGVETQGREKLHKETYIVENVTLFSEAELRLMNEGKTLAADGEVDVISIKRSKICEILNTRTNDCERVFLATLVDEFVNEDGSKKEIKYTVAFYSTDISHAHTFVKQYLAQGYTMELKAIKETKIIDVLKGEIL